MPIRPPVVQATSTLTIEASLINMQGRHATAGKHTATLYAYDTVYSDSQATSTVCTRSTCSPITEENNPAIAYTGAWTSSSCTHTGCSANHTEKASVVSGNQAVLTFTGTKVVCKGSKGTQGGKAAVYVDGVLKATVSEYRSTVASGLAIYTSPLLARGHHTLKMSRKG